MESFLSNKALHRAMPHSKRRLTTRESIILLEASKLNGAKFVPWVDGADYRELESCGEYEDDTVYSFSEAQSKVLAGWESCSAIERRLSDAPLESDHDKVHDLVQDVTTDCSVVASLCALTSHTERGFANLCCGVFYPWDLDHHRPGRSSSGKYIFRFYFNGSFRKVIIDDRLPISKSARRFFVTDRNAPSRLWPALLEKAYLKVRGGYNFPGSNSGTDISVVTGWIPEQIYLQSEDLDHTALWRRLSTSFHYGDILITIGTGTIAAEEERGSGLATQHDYAVVDMKEEGTQRNLLVKNPWAGTPHDRTRNQLKDQPRLGPGSLTGLTQAHECEEADARFSNGRPGARWMTFDKCFHFFESLYLNWNPALFKFRQDVHFSWNPSSSDISNVCFRSNPQFSLRSAGVGVLWVLLTRHFMSRDEQRKPCDLLDEGYISVYAFRSAFRVPTARGAIKNSKYVDSPNTLLKLDLDDLKPLTLVVSEQSLPRRRHDFTLSCFAFANIELDFAQEKFTHRQRLSSAWTKSTAGGNSGSPDYYRNPQFSLDLKHSSDLRIILHSTLHSIHMHVALFWGNGKRIRNISARDIVGDSGEYTNEVALAEFKDVATGKYTVVCSTFEHGQTAPFELDVSATTECQVQALSAPEAGQFVTQTTSLPFGHDAGHVKLTLNTQRLNEVSISVRPHVIHKTAVHRAAKPLRVSVLCGHGPMARTLACSNGGEFSDPGLSGIHLRDVVISPDDCLAHGVYLVVEFISGVSGDSNESVDVYIYSQDRMVTGHWSLG